jgi:hypothetical protein
MPRPAKFMDRIDRGGSPPAEQLGYLSPSAGSFTLDGKSGHASYVWYHGDALVVDWHHHELVFEGTHTAGPVTFWVYGVQGHGDHDHGEHDHGHEHGDDDLHLLFADRRTNGDQASDSDEGYRIFYGLHGELHLMAWDAKTFAYHQHRAA